jgi:hypothetical protein
MADEKSQFQIILATSRSALALVRESAIILLILVVLIWPDALQNVLKKAGFNELDLGFLKWQKEIEAAQQEVKDANQILAQVQKEISDATESIETIKNTTDLKPETRAEINKLSVKLDESNKATTMARGNLQQNIAVQSRFMNEFQQVAPVEEGPWGILVGADKDEESAKHELEKFRRRGFENIQIYIKSGWYRTVIVFEDHGGAEEQLNRIIELSESAYIINLSSWCPSSIEKEPGILYECR